VLPGGAGDLECRADAPRLTSRRFRVGGAGQIFPPAKTSSRDLRRTPHRQTRWVLFDAGGRKPRPRRLDALLAEAAAVARRRERRVPHARTSIHGARRRCLLEGCVCASTLGRARGGTSTARKARFPTWPFLPGPAGFGAHPAVAPITRHSIPTFGASRLGGRRGQGHRHSPLPGPHARLVRCGTTTACCFAGELDADRRGRQKARLLHLPAFSLDPAANKKYIPPISKRRSSAIFPSTVGVHRPSGLATAGRRPEKAARRPESARKAADG